MINFTRTVTTNEIDPVGAAMFLLDGLGKKAVALPLGGGRGERGPVAWWAPWVLSGVP